MGSCRLLNRRNSRKIFSHTFPLLFFESVEKPSFILQLAGSHISAVGLHEKIVSPCRGNIDTRACVAVWAIAQSGPLLRRLLMFPLRAAQLLEIGTSTMCRTHMSLPQESIQTDQTLASTVWLTHPERTDAAPAPVPYSPGGHMLHVVLRWSLAV